MTNSLEYCRLWHGFISTSQDIHVAEQFGLDGLSQSIIFKILRSNLQGTQNLLFGDISWISVNIQEKEVLFGPCLLDITKVQDDSDDAYENTLISKNSNSNSNFNANTNTSRVSISKTLTKWFNVRPKPVQPVRSLLNR